jgi:hypothetical protein
MREKWLWDYGAVCLGATTRHAATNLVTLQRPAVWRGGPWLGAKQPLHMCPSSPVAIVSTKKVVSLWLEDVD